MGSPQGPRKDALPPPGSPGAVAQGCTCDPVKNHNGEGTEGGRVFYPDWTCPLHGLDVIAEE